MISNINIRMIDYVIVSTISACVVAGIIVFFIKRQPSSHQELDQRIDLLNQHIVDNLNTISQNFTTQLHHMNQRIDERLERTTESMNSRMDRVNDITREVSGELSSLKERSEKIYEIGKDVASLQELLKAPKMRGGLGEFMLADLLSQILPSKHFSLQYPFKSGAIVDAVVILRDNILLCIDSKFPLENFRRMMESSTEKETMEFKKLFKRDLKKHIDDISSKYILPDEKTLDIAFMYIPSENVYYETIMKDDNEDSIFSYCSTKRVIPVSPNSFYVYLQTISLGLRGMQIEQRAKEIMDDLKRLSTNLTAFQKDFSILGKHINNAGSSYQNAEKTLQRFSTKLMLTEKQVDIDRHIEEDIPLLTDIEEAA